MTTSMKKAKILVIDDEEGMRDLLAYELSKVGYAVTTAASGSEGIALARKQYFDLAITDLKMPGMDGLETIAGLKNVDPRLEVIMITGYATVETAVACMKLGAYDYIQKPFNHSEFQMVVERALEKAKLKADVALYESSQAVLSTLVREDLLRFISDLVLQVVQADEAALLLPEEGGGLSAVYCKGKTDTVSVADRAEACRRLAAQDGRPFVLTEGMWNDPRCADVRGWEQVRSAIIYPLVSNNQLVGMLNLNRVATPDPFTQCDLDRVALISNQIAVALANANLYRELEERINKLKTVEGQSLFREKIATIGTLASGIAHEINNPMAFIKSNLMQMSDLLQTLKRFFSLVERVCTAPPESGASAASLHTSLQELRDAWTGERIQDVTETFLMILNESAAGVERIEKIVKGIFEFSQGSSEEKEPVDLLHPVESALNVLQAGFRSRAVIVRELKPLSPVIGKEKQLALVFLNILLNAVQAVPGGGEVRIRSYQDNGWNCVQIRDDGPGIPPENLSKIFDPFYTTKDIGKGKGLGLSVCLGIIQSYGGTIDVESAPGCGTTFTVRLPSLKAGMPQEIPEGSLPAV